MCVNLLYFCLMVVIEYAVWQELSENIGNLVSLYRSETFFPKFQEFVRGMYSKQMELLGWTAQPGENQRTGTLRGTIISILTSAGDQAVLETSSQWFAAYAKGEREIPGDLRRIVFKAALRFDELNPDSDGSTFDTLKQLYEQSSFPEDQRNYLAVIGSVKDMKKHREILDYTLFSGSVRLQDIVFPLNALSSSSDEGGRACWAYFKDNYTKIQETFEDGRMWAAVVGLSCKGLRTLAEADEVESFFESKPPGSAKRRLVQALENIRTRALRLSRDRNAVAAFLSESLPLK